MADKYALVDTDFSAVKENLKNLLAPEMMDWNYQTLVNALVQEVERYGREAGLVNKRNRNRSFARHVLGFTGPDKFKVLTQWMHGLRTMNVKEMETILRAITHVRTRAYALPPQANQKRFEGTRESVTQTKKVEKVTHQLPDSVTRRRIVEHTISMVNSLEGLIEAVTADEVFDGDKMQIISAIERMCRQLGIKVRFPEDRTEKCTPVSSQEMRE